MRVLIVGSLGGQMHTATKIAMDRGAKVSQVDTIEQATAHLRAGRGADLLMVDLNLDVQSLIASNELERITVPVVACGVNVREAFHAFKKTSWARSSTVSGTTTLPSFASILL